MRQVVIYLKETSSDLVRQTSFTMERTRHEFDVIRSFAQLKCLPVTVIFYSLIPLHLILKAFSAPRLIKRGLKIP
jgi:predicted transposase YdaD